MRPGVFITVDVECSMGGAWDDDSLRPVSPDRAVFGRYGNREMGLPLIIDTLVNRGLAGTFFVEPFAEEQGHKLDMEEAVTYLRARGQDVQLHVHPNHMSYGLKQKGAPYRFDDAFQNLPPDEQRALVRVGADRLDAWTGQRPVAFRAGNMAASEASLPSLAAEGITIDSSYTFPYAGGQCGFSAERPFNGTRWYGDVLEVALSGFRQAPLPGLHAAKPLDLVGVSFRELATAIESICKTGAMACAILHSFSLFKVRNVQYDDGRPDRIVTRRLERLCDWLRDRRDELPTYTFTELAEAVADGTLEAVEAPLPRLGPLRSVCRKVVQAYNNLYWT